MVAHPKRNRRHRDCWLLCTRPSSISAWILVETLDSYDEAATKRLRIRLMGINARDIVIKKCSTAPNDAEGVLAKLNTV